MNEYYEARQHLNLSELAFDVIENDKYIFQDHPSRSGILNRIFSVYRDYADASIETACMRFREQLEERLESVSDDTTKEAVISSLIAAYKSELISMATSYPSGHSFKFQLNQENYRFIQEWRDVDDVYASTPGKYIKAVLEEYARKPYVEREMILFRDFIETVNACVESHLSMIVTLYSGLKFEIRPYGVLVDQGNNYHYLVCYAKQAGEQGPDIACSFRVTNIREHKLYYGRSGRITEAQRRELERKINTIGVQFLLQTPDLIRVKLTKQGKAMYDSQFHIRPAFVICTESENDEWIYEFNCTQIQAQFYFFKFGRDAEILYPEELRNRFIAQYQEALSQYK